MTVGALRLRGADDESRLAGGSRAYILGLCCGVYGGDDVTEFDRPRGLSCGEEPFCLVRFICKHRSG